MIKPQIFFPEKQIIKRIAELADEIRQDYRGKSPLLLGILKGSVIFLSDMIRQLDMPVEIDFIKLSSYRSQTTSSGNVQLLQDTTLPIEGKDILIIEDIVDTGLTVSFLISHLKTKNPSSVRLCTLLDKPSRRQVPVHIDYIGFTIPDKFVVGYGIDYNEQFRHLRDICLIE